MNVRTMIDAAVSTLEREAQIRMRAAMKLGARFALEAVMKESPYGSDAKMVLAQLDGEKVATRAPVEAIPPAPVSEPEPEEISI